jgi:hypothetical protein
VEMLHVIEVICSRCYTRGSASASLTSSGDFNDTQILESVDNSVSDTIDQLVDWIDDIDFDVSEFSLDIPAPNVSFNVDLAGFPEYELEFRFDELELYMELDTTLSSGMTYMLSLFQSTEFGIELGQDLLLGLVFSIDLILSVDSDMAMKSGFHVKLDDGVLLRLALFSDQASDMVL